MNEVGPNSRSEDTIKNITRDYIRHKLSADADYQWLSPLNSAAAENQPTPPPPSKLNETVRRLGTEFEEKYGAAFQEMSSQLQVSEQTAEPTLIAVANELFKDGIQWGRLVALLAFAGSLAKQCVANGCPQTVDSIAESTVNFIEKNLATWIEEHGSWEGFIEFYKQGTGSQIDHDLPWPSLGKFFCGVAAGALGALTIGAFLTSR